MGENGRARPFFKVNRNREKRRFFGIVAILKEFETIYGDVHVVQLAFFLPKVKINTNYFVLEGGLRKFRHFCFQTDVSLFVNK